MVQSNIPVADLYVYSLLRERFGCNSVRYNYVTEYIKRVFNRLPRDILFKMIKEMEKHELIKKLNRETCLILSNNQIRSLHDPII